MKQVLSVLFLGSILFTAGCKDEPAYTAGQLTGYWQVYGAERDGKETTLLNGAVFVFSEDGTMLTNITGQESSGTFELDNNQITVTGGNAMVLSIEHLSGDSLTLQTELQEMAFLLDLQRTTTEPQ